MLRAVTWNIKFGQQIERAAAELAALGPFDLILAQELDGDGAMLLAERLETSVAYHARGPHRVTGRSFGNAVLSPHPLTTQPAVELPSTALIRGHPRHVTWAQIQTPDGALRVGSLHLETPYLRLRHRVDQLVTAIATSFGPHPVVVGGDFNTLTRRSITAMQRAVAPMDFHRAPAPTMRVGRLGLRLDHFITAGVLVHTTEVLTNTTASDHFPLIMTFELL